LDKNLLIKIIFRSTY